MEIKGILHVAPQSGTNSACIAEARVTWLRIARSATRTSLATSAGSRGTSGRLASQATSRSSSSLGWRRGARCRVPFLLWRGRQSACRIRPPTRDSWGRLRRPLNASSGRWVRSIPVLKAMMQQGAGRTWEIKCTTDTGATRAVVEVDVVRRLGLATTASSVRLYTTKAGERM